MSRLLSALLGLGLFCFSLPLQSQDIAVRGTIVYPVTSPPIENAVVVVRNGKITALGPAGRVTVPDSVPVIEAEVVTPGLIDARSVVGLAGYLNQDDDQDQLERSEAIQPELRAIDAYNPREELVGWLRSFGVTTIHTGHAPGEIISGQTMIAKTRGRTIEEAVMVRHAMVAATLGEGAVVQRANNNGRKSPGSRSKAVAMLRSELVNARTYAESIARAAQDDDKAAPDRNLRLEALLRVLDGDAPLLVTVHRHHDIVSALRLAEEFGFRLILDGAAEAYLVADEIRAAEVPVLVHAPMVRAWGERDNASFTTPAKLLAEGIPFAFQSGFESYVPKTRVVLFEAAITLQHGLSFDEALAGATIEAARILGVADRVGSLEVGKDGDLALYDGDPFEYTSHAIGTIIEGIQVSDISR